MGSEEPLACDEDTGSPAPRQRETVPFFSVATPLGVRDLGFPAQGPNLCPCSGSSESYGCERQF